jgi:hypothetical protein
MKISILSIIFTSKLGKTLASISFSALSVSFDSPARAWIVGGEVLGACYSRRFASFAVSSGKAEGLPQGSIFYARDERATSAARAIARIVSERLGEFVERGAGDGGAEQGLQLRGIGE